MRRVLQATPTRWHGHWSLDMPPEAELVCRGANPTVILLLVKGRAAGLPNVVCSPSSNRKRRRRAPELCLCAPYGIRAHKPLSLAYESMLFRHHACGPRSVAICTPRSRRSKPQLPSMKFQLAAARVTRNLRFRRGLAEQAGLLKHLCKLPRPRDALSWTNHRSEPARGSYATAIHSRCNPRCWRAPVKLHRADSSPLASFNCTDNVYACAACERARVASPLCSELTALLLNARRKVGRFDPTLPVQELDV